MRASDYAWPGARGVAFVAAALSLGLHLSANAQQAPSREQEQLRRLRQQVQQLQQEQAISVEQARKVAAEKQQVEQKAGAERAALERRLKSAESLVSGRITQLQSKFDAANADSAALQAKMSELQQQSNRELAQVRERLSARDKAYAQLEAANKQRASQVEALMRNNAALYKLGLELLGRYQNKTVAEAMADQEPFLQLKRVQLENLVQDYEDRLDKERASGPGSR